MFKALFLEKAAVKGKRVLVRADLDVPLGKSGEVEDTTRIELALPTLKFLLQKGAKVIVAAHLGRPGGRKEAGLSLQPVAAFLAGLLGNEGKVSFIGSAVGKKVTERVRKMKPGELLVLENLRFYKGEEKNNFGFAKRLARLAEIYVNESFANSHREHASMVGVVQFLPVFFGKRLLKEMEVLEKVYKEPKRPVVVVLGGKKESKLVAGQILLGWADTILVGGKLAETNGIKEFAGNKKVLADLTKKGEDITLESARKFGEILRKAGTIVWSGPMGAYEEERWLRGTEAVARATVESKAFSVVGGGDTEAALTKLGLEEKVGFMSSGGGAMLTFLARGGRLPAVEAMMASYKKRRQKGRIK